METLDSMGLVLRAASFAADKHADQRRKDPCKTPYINHPLEVARILYEEGHVRDVNLLAAAILHDTVEDTDASLADIEAYFGADVARIVGEVTDDTSLPKLARKQKQVERSGTISPEAQQLKLADKISNLRDIYKEAPVGWSTERQTAYFDWAARVVANIRGVNADLEASFDAIQQAYLDKRSSQRS